MAHWFIDCDGGGFPFEKGALSGCDLSVAHVGGEWQWLVRCDGRDLAEGSARGYLAVRKEAEAVARPISTFCGMAA